MAATSARMTTRNTLPNVASTCRRPRGWPASASAASASRAAGCGSTAGSCTSEAYSPVPDGASPEESRRRASAASAPARTDGAAIDAPASRSSSASRSPAREASRARASLASEASLRPMVPRASRSLTSLSEKPGPPEARPGAKSARAVSMDTVPTVSRARQARPGSEWASASRNSSAYAAAASPSPSLAETSARSMHSEAP